MSGSARATRTLRELFSQTCELAEELDQRPELIILYEKDVVAPKTIEKAVAAAGNAPLDVSLHATEGSNYYGQKNEGAELASRDYLLFLDSDVVPEAGWLRAMLGSLSNGVHVVAGSTSVETDTFFGRAFGLFWFFPIRSPSRGLVETRFFYANNVMFLRKLFLAHKFPDLPLYRGHCSVLGAILKSRGIRLYQQTNARVIHPPPNVLHFIHRALSEGYDVTTRARMARRQRDLGAGELRRQLEEVRIRINNRSEVMKIGRNERLAATMLGRTYCLLRFAGQVWAARAPEHAQHTLGIRTFRIPSTTKGNHGSISSPQGG